MSFVRPEVSAGFLRWREVIIGGALVLAGVHLAIFGLGIQRLMGAGLAAIGAMLIWEGVRRARFPAPGGGAGMVDVDEREITYFGPLGGGSISINELVRVNVRTSDLGPLAPDLYWDFFDGSGQSLTIPGDAEGVELIFDALAALEGVDYEAATKAAGTTEDMLFTIWQKASPKLVR
ncbi:MAG: hypothetical protein ABJF50_05050 [Paracoccaceae bacterium]